MSDQDPTVARIRPGISDAEWQARIELAACYRLVALFGWDELVANHLTARVPDAPEHILINPLGMLYDEIKASDFVKVNGAGERVDGGSGRINPGAMALHGGVHDARPDVACVMHLHTDAGIVVSLFADGLMPLALETTAYQDSISYHAFEGITIVDEERETMVRDLGQNNIMFLRNHGIAICGGTIAEAFLRAYMVEKGCRIQIAARSQGVAPQQIEPALVPLVIEQFRPFAPTLADLSFKALMRRLDRIDPSYRQ